MYIFILYSALSVSCLVASYENDVLHEDSVVNNGQQSIPLWIKGYAHPEIDSDTIFRNTRNGPYEFQKQKPPVVCINCELPNSKKHKCEQHNFKNLQHSSTSKSTVKKKETKTFHQHIAQKQQTTQVNVNMPQVFVKQDVMKNDVQAKFNDLKGQAQKINVEEKIKAWLNRKNKVKTGMGGEISSDLGVFQGEVDPCSCKQSKIELDKQITDILPPASPTTCPYHQQQQQQQQQLFYQSENQKIETGKEKLPLVYEPPKIEFEKQKEYLPLPSYEFDQQKEMVPVVYEPPKIELEKQIEFPSLPSYQFHEEKEQLPVPLPYEPPKIELEKQIEFPPIPSYQFDQEKQNIDTKKFIANKKINLSKIKAGINKENAKVMFSKLKARTKNVQLPTKESTKIKMNNLKNRVQKIKIKNIRRQITKTKLKAGLQNVKYRTKNIKIPKIKTAVRRNDVAIMFNNLKYKTKRISTPIIREKLAGMKYKAKQQSNKRIIQMKSKLSRNLKYKMLKIPILDTTVMKNKVKSKIGTVKYKTTQTIKRNTKTTIRKLRYRATRIKTNIIPKIKAQVMNENVKQKLSNIRTQMKNIRIPSNIAIAKQKLQYQIRNTKRYKKLINIKRRIYLQRRFYPMLEKMKIKAQLENQNIYKKYLLNRLRLKQMVNKRITINTAKKQENCLKPINEIKQEEIKPMISAPVLTQENWVKPTIEIKAEEVKPMISTPSVITQENWEKPTLEIKQEEVIPTISIPSLGEVNIESAVHHASGGFKQKFKEAANIAQGKMSTHTQHHISKTEKKVFKVEHKSGSSSQITINKPNPSRPCAKHGKSKNKCGPPCRPPPIGPPPIGPPIHFYPVPPPLAIAPVPVYY